VEKADGGEHSILTGEPSPRTQRGIGKELEVFGMRGVDLLTAEDLRRGDVMTT
jgi:hypothetical protein